MMMENIPFEKFTEEVLKPARIICKNVADEFLNHANVVACGVGLKSINNQFIDEPSVVVSVSNKRPSTQLKGKDLIPRSIGGIKTDVIQTGVIRPTGFNRTIATRPVRPGMSIGHINGTAGTIGCIVERNGEHYILSNNHVLALLNRSSIGDLILQPGPSDGGTRDDAIGALVDYVPLRFLSPEAESPDEQRPVVEEEPQGCLRILGLLTRNVNQSIEEYENTALSTKTQMLKQDNRVDAALARPFDPSAIETGIIDIGTAPAGTIVPRLGMTVIKSGRTSGLTQGRIVQIDVTVNVTYEEDKVARFKNQIMTTPFSERGDSGSLVLDFERRAVGLLFSGSSVVSMVNPINPVLDSLRCTLITV